MIEKINANYTISKEGKIKQINTLKQSKKVLKREYEDITGGINALYLVGTFKEINDSKVSDETQRELQEQIDIFNAYEELSDKVEIGE